jgi:vacuolar-type H+-ATPase subunit H
VKSSNVSKNDRNTPPEKLTLRLKKAETAVEVAAASLKSIRTLIEREGDDVLNQAQQSHTEHLLKDLKKLNEAAGSSAQSVG